jgi:hypothetical protein
MDEHEFGEALLRASAADNRDLPDAWDLASRVLARDRRRLRALGGVILALWLAGAAGISFVLYNLAIYVPEYMRLMMKIEEGGMSMEQRQRIQENNLGGFQIGLSITVGSVAILALAALGTFLLVLTSRRATLRQVNASLALISEQLRQLSWDRAGARHAASTAPAEDRTFEP